MRCKGSERKPGWPDALGYLIVGFAFGYLLAAVFAARSWGGIP